MASDVEDRVRSTISQLSGVDPGNIGLETRIKEDLGLTDSQIAELFAAFKSQFGMGVPNDEAEKRVIDVIEYYESVAGRQAE